jgi:hypothetical protein
LIVVLCAPIVPNVLAAPWISVLTPGFEAATASDSCAVELTRVDSACWL